MESLGTEVRSFYSLAEIREVLEEEINQYKAIAEEYSQWLGLFLRDSEAANSDKEWFKNLSSMQKLTKARKTQKTEKKEGKKKKEPTSIEWVPYRDIMLCATEQGQAEIVFEAIEKINDKIDKLEKTKNSFNDLEKSGLGKDVTYVVFMHDGIPEKLVLRHKKGEELSERFKFITELSVSADSE